ncbi:pro-sigmaK processing inhibitor BofA family protein [Bacillus sp. N9]
MDGTSRHEDNDWCIVFVFLNAVGNQFGVYVPINFATSTISGFLGLPGVAALTIIQLYILV